jgi:hypothetical protein
MNFPSEVQLQPPGAGLPLPELLVGRLIFWFRRRLMSREQALAHFRAEASTIRRLAESLSPADAARPTLIPRIVGIEDSSRNWSVFMTVEHLVIVDESAISILESLAAGKTLPTRFSTANVKPGPVQDGEVLQRFSITVEDYARTVRKLPSLRTHAKQAHPWFGPLDAHGRHLAPCTHIIAVRSTDHQNGSVTFRPRGAEPPRFPLRPRPVFRAAVLTFTSVPESGRAMALLSNSGCSLPSFLPRVRESYR